MFFLTFGALGAYADEKKEAIIYKNIQCGCCDGYIEYLRTEDFDVTVMPVDNVTEIKNQYGVPEGYRSCHTMLLDGYVVEGHVPVATLNRLLSERPDISGIALPGMPQGSPGMPGGEAEPLTIYEWSDGPPEVYAVE
jgi:hypothetical protein